VAYFLGHPVCALYACFSTVSAAVSHKLSLYIYGRADPTSLTVRGQRLKEVTPTAAVCRA